MEKDLVPSLHRPRAVVGEGDAAVVEAALDGCNVIRAKGDMPLFNVACPVRKLMLRSFAARCTSVAPSVTNATSPEYPSFVTRCHCGPGSAQGLGLRDRTD